MKNRVTIRRASISDADTLSTLGRSTFTDTFGHLYRPADLDAFLRDSHSPAYYEDLLSDKACATWIANDGTGAAVGYCSCGPCGLPVAEMPEKSGELHRLYIEKGQQSAGLGRRFLDVALGWLEANFDHLYVGVWSQNEGAQRLYRSYGFQKISDYIFMVGEHPDSEWIMKRCSGI